MNLLEHTPASGTKIKICGILPEDIEKTATLKPDGIGFYDWPQEERGSTPTTREGSKYIANYAISHSIDPYYLTYEADGKRIFDDYQEIFEGVEGKATPHIQLVGNIPNDEIKKLSEHLRNELSTERRQAKIVRSLGFAAAMNRLMLPNRQDDTFWFEDGLYVDGYIFDSHKGSQHGGTGTVHNWGWSSIGMQLVKANHGPSVWLAGGLNISNLDDALRAVRPYGVDIESGTQNRDRSKNFAIMQELIQKAHSFQQD